jgi:hypothetical protein
VFLKQRKAAGLGEEWSAVFSHVRHGKKNEVGFVYVYRSSCSGCMTVNILKHLLHVT